MLEYLERKIEEEESEMIVKKETQKKYKRDIVAMPNKNPNLLFFFSFFTIFPFSFLSLNRSKQRPALYRPSEEAPAYRFHKGLHRVLETEEELVGKKEKKKERNQNQTPNLVYTPMLETGKISK